MTNTSYSYLKPQITFFGTIFSAKGMKPGSIKIPALQDLPTPQNQKVTVIPGTSQLFTTIPHGYCFQDHCSLGTSFKIGLDILYRQHISTAKAMDLQHSFENNLSLLG